MRFQVRFPGYNSLAFSASLALSRALTANGWTAAPPILAHYNVTPPKGGVVYWVGLLPPRGAVKGEARHIVVTDGFIWILVRVSAMIS